MPFLRVNVTCYGASNVATPWFTSHIDPFSHTASQYWPFDFCISNVSTPLVLPLSEYASLPGVNAVSLSYSISCKF